MPAYWMSITVCPRNCFRQQPCAPQLRGSIMELVIPKYLITRSMRLLLAEHDTCQLGRQRSTCLCATYDILFVQSAGNVLMSSDIIVQPGVKEHLAAGRDYPKYLYEASTRVANPAQSLQALTVGSVAYGYFQKDDWKTFAGERDYPSAFSRSGHGYGALLSRRLLNMAVTMCAHPNVPPDVQSGDQIAAACPELVRSTMSLPGPLFDAW